MNYLSQPRPLPQGFLPWESSAGRTTAAKVTVWSVLCRWNTLATSAICCGTLASRLSIACAPDGRERCSPPQAKKKADVVEPPEGFRHVGLLINAPSSRSRVALYLVVRKRLSHLIESPRKHLATHHDSTRPLVSFISRNAIKVSVLLS